MLVVFRAITAPSSAKSEMICWGDNEMHVCALGTNRPDAVAVLL